MVIPTIPATSVATDAKENRGRGSSSKDTTTISDGLSAHDQVQLLRLLSQLTPFASSGSVNLITPPSGVPWILDFGASFHMTPNSSILTSLGSLSSSPISVQTADGTPMAVTHQTGMLLGTDHHHRDH